MISLENLLHFASTHLRVLWCTITVHRGASCCVCVRFHASVYENISRFFPVLARLFPRAGQRLSLTPQGISRAHTTQRRRAKAWPRAISAAFRSAMWRAGQGGRHGRKRITPCRAAVSCFRRGPTGHDSTGDVHWRRCTGPYHFSAFR